MKIGVFGGSFNPPHNGHVYIAREVKRRLGLDKVLFMVAAEAPHKSIAYGVDASLRFELTRAALEGEEGLYASDNELVRGGVSYTVDTLRALYTGCDELYLIVGADMLSTLHTWREAQTLFRLANIAAVGRGADTDLTDTARTLEAFFGARVFLTGIEGGDISSTLVRSRVHDALGIASLVPKGVMERIYSHLLYQDEQTVRHATHLKELIKPSRYAHSLSTMGYCAELASRWGADGRVLRTAGLLHDCAKVNETDILSLAAHYGYMPSEEERTSPAILHGPVGAIRAERDFGITDKAVLDAIQCHVYGKVGMSLTDKILFVADKAEPSRRYDGVEELRQLADRDIDRAAYTVADNSINHLIKKGIAPSKASLEVRQSLMKELY